MLRFAPAVGAAILAGCAAAPIDRFPAQANESVPNSQAAIFPPDTPGKHPAVILLHTCGGVGGHLNQWRNRFAFEGYVVFVADSFGPRGVKVNCGLWTVTVDQVAADALAAAAHLRKRADVDPGRIYAVGFSYGASAAMRLASASYVKRQANPVPFSAVAAVYPDCGASFSAPAAVQERGNNFYTDIATPMLLLLGGADTETPPANCVTRADELRKAGQPVSYRVFPGATHGFDQQAPGAGYRYDFGAVDESFTLMREFFKQH